MPNIEFEANEPDAYWGWRVSVAEQAGEDGHPRYVVACRYMLGRETEAVGVRPVVFPPTTSPGAARRLRLLLESVAVFMNTGGSTDVLKVVSEAMRGEIAQPGELVDTVRAEDRLVHVYRENDGLFTLVSPDYGVGRATRNELHAWYAARQRDADARAREALEAEQRRDGTYRPFSWHYEPQSAVGGEHVEANSNLQSLPPPSP